MAQTCSRCSSVNPADALFCYHDGANLGTARGAAPAAAARFPAPFIFPSGKACHSYDELSRGCLANWQTAVQMLREGFLERFLGGLGRGDLVMAARAAAAFPDPERGLDQLLSRLPTQTVQPPKLSVTPAEVNLGTIEPGKAQRFDLHLTNQGERLLYGSVVCDSPWLTLGDGQGGPQKLFQVRDEGTVPVQFRGDHLRASERPVEARLVIESSGGSTTIAVKAQVRPRPFPDGPLAGALTPRALAEKAKANPRAAAPLFESGAVQRWYASNGWTYPVPGPAASGIAAVQQFFEALGLTRPPKVEICDAALTVQAPAGDRVQRSIRLQTPEKRPVFAHARGEQSWLVVGKVQHNGPSAVIPIDIAAPPGASGHTLQGRVFVTANGNQRFVVPVTLSVGAPMPGAAAVTAVPPGRPTFTREAGAGGRLQTVPPTADDERRRRQGVPLFVHLLPFAALLFLMVGVSLKDVIFGPPKEVQIAVTDDDDKKGGGDAVQIKIEDEPDEQIDGKGPPLLAQVIDEPEVRDPVLVPVKVEIKDEPEEGGRTVGGGGPEAPVDPQPRISFNYGMMGRFGVSAAGTGKRLTYSNNGSTNNMVVKLDGQTIQYGRAGAPERVTQLPQDPRHNGQSPVQSTWTVGGVEYTQTFELVPSKQPVEVAPGVQKRLVDTMLVRYEITNRDNRPHRVGLRNQIDTLIGGNDGVPFTVPGLPGLVNQFKDFPTPDTIPDFIQALETGQLQNPGTVVNVTLKVGGGLEPPSQMRLTHWPGSGDNNWFIPLRPMGSDSAVVLLWDEAPLDPGKTRKLGFGYGLGNVTANEGQGRLAVTLGGSFEPGQIFTVTAYVTNPAAGQTLSLELPAGLERVEGEPTQPVQGGNTSVVTWKAKVLQTGTHKLRVASSTGTSQTKTISIARPEGPAGGDFTLKLNGSFEPGKEFNVLADVTKPVAGQTLTLKLPLGLTRVGGDEVQAVGGAGGPAWKVRVDAEGKYPVRVQSSTGLVQTKTIVIARADQGAGRVTVKLGGEIAPGKAFTVTADVANPVPGQSLTLTLSPKLRRVRGQENEPLPPAAGNTASVSWSVAVDQPGRHTVAVKSSTGVTVRKTLAIDGGAGRFDLELAGTIKKGEPFDVIARVTSAVPGQKLTLKLPEGLKLEGVPEVQAVPPGGSGASVVTWRVRVVGLGRLPVRVESTTGVARTKTLTLTGVEGPGQIFGGR